ncbi:uncharacterized protein PV06_10349 [Exophiala oligosperma]|uniref:Major facilitator superfamily (MFS) profile domain-containing protein n=2 Tax=Chaetothyriales TaxID=34395 RepID=A0A0D2D333_9EURO|nr:uncharacterized protein PV06_10349 [Exophiala oligosperma]KAJ9633602.1 hypothetical protein H2204_006808 [Knufia peltigerae]KIW37718.1 hypothetical protein PV06_10349 [Exophiala oligosperma]
MVLQGTKLYYNALFAGSLGFITFGWDAGVLGGVLLTPEFMSAVGNPTDTYKISMITSTFLLASWFGCMVITFFGIHLGRKNWILLGNAVELVGTIISASSYSYGQLIAGRVFIGIGNGFLTSMIPVYMAEIATEKKLRGRGVNAMIAAASLGTALAYWVDFGMVFAHGTQAVWRFPVAFQAFWGVSTMIAFMRLPETPRYYYAKGQVEKADSTLEQVYGMDLTEGRVQQAKAEILAALELELAAAPSLKVMDFFWDSSSMQVARRIRTGVLLIGIAYLMGIDMIFYYMTTIFQVYIGLEPLTSSGLAGTATTVLAITNYLGVYYMEKFGRRTWLITGAVVQTIFMATFTGLLSSPGTKTGAAAAAMLFIWIAVFGPTWGPVTYVYASEIMPLRYRHIGFALSVSSQWLMAFTTVFAGPIAIADKSVGWKTWIWFLVFNFIAIPYVYFCCPETRGRTLEEIDLIFITDTLKDTTAAKTLEHEGHESELTSELDSVNEKTIQTQEQGVDVAKSADMEAPKEAPESSS